MTRIRKPFQKLENKYHAKVQIFIRRHPCLAFLIMFVGIPLATLIIVCLCITMITLPIFLLLYCI